MILNIASTIILLAVFFGVMYFTMNTMLEQKISKINVSQEELEEFRRERDAVIQEMLHVSGALEVISGNELTNKVPML